MWFFVSFLGSLGVKNQPGITTLGLITIPAIICLIIAIIKTYRELPETGKLPGFVDKEGTQTPQFNMKFGIIGYGFIILVILVSTYLYYSQPVALEVPNNADPTMWQNPSFENTILYEQIVPEEKDKLLSEGIPNKDNLALIVISDLMAIFIASLCFIHAYKNFGFWMASCFLLGSFLCTGMGESILILSGRFIFGGNTNNMLGDMFYGTFWYPKAWLWFIHCPIMICIGWYQVAYCCVWVATKVFPRMNLYLRAVMGGLIAMNIDLWLDPVATSTENMSWIWGKGDPLELFGIPVWNFWGWFLCITVFAILWENLPRMTAKWGLKKGTINFFLICFFCCFIAMGLIYLYHIVLGGVFALFGVQHAIQLPVGW
jgi:uncharacterized membrane protein